MEILEVTNTGFGLKQTMKRYLAPFMASEHKPGLKKIANAFLAEIERRLGKAKVSSRPFILHFEPTNLCNLRCPNCYTGSGQNELAKGMLKLDDFKKVIDEVKGHVILSRLDGTGESFLNPDLYEMIGYASKSGIMTSISTNLTMLAPGDAERIVRSGLDHIIISLDGATKDIYESVRVGAKFEDVLRNIRGLVAFKKKAGARHPFIELQFIEFENTAGQVEEVKKLAAELGADRLFIKEAREDILAGIRNKEGKGDHCYWLWFVLNVAWTGDLKACCTSGLISPYCFGNIIKRTVEEEWNNEAMRRVREVFSGKESVSTELLKGCKCLRCYKLTGKW
jgi:MoaA/NifB/PqqE/SkfB family radical SAM enzyme